MAAIPLTSLPPTMSDSCCSHGCATTARPPSARYRRVLWAALAINTTMFVVELAGGLRAAITETGMVDQVRWICTHVWNGRWHRHEQCFWVPGHHQRHHHHHHHHRHHR